MRSRSLLSVVAVLLSPVTLPAEDVDYLRDIKPLLTEKCSACHGALEQEAGLRLDATQLIRAGGDSGAIITPGDPDTSVLWERVSASDPSERMPPEGEGEPLDAKQLALLRTWIKAGAPAADEEPVPAGPKDHWAYQPPVRAPVPVSGDHRERHPIDAFLGAAQHEAGVEPLPPADRATLLRRVTFDLIGLPPTPEDLLSFLQDESEGAYERRVDRLVESPQHGERWARHWMDVWRYSDWDGYKNELRGSQRHIWRWRDWIVESLNADAGYDQMIREMLAGDELAPTDGDVLRATGFLARNYHKSNRNIWLDATVEHTAKAFLGMTINCARCHDHKYDPILQTDYYAFRAIFEPHEVRIDRLPGQPDVVKDGLTRAYDAKPDAQTFLYVAGNEKHPDEEHPLPARIPEMFGGLSGVTDVTLPVTAWYPTLQEFIRSEDVSAAEARLAKARQELEGQIGQRSADDVGETVDSIPPVPPLPRTVPIEEQLARARVSAAEAELASLRARWAADEARNIDQDETADQLAVEAARLERTAKLRKAHVEGLTKQQALTQAEAEQDEAKRKAAVDKATKELAAATEAVDESREALESDDAKYTPIGKVYPKTSTGRRSALAAWITTTDNPLTARVAVNHIWMRHFGEPLVANVFDFGLRSPRPIHADLLDWLAVELMEGGWSMKHLHRLIVTSDAYRRASSADTALTAANETVDPDNELLWRANVRRLNAEVVRDSVLAVSGSLDLTPSGPDIDFHDGEEVPRRSLYFRHAYEKQMTMLVLFDAANPTDCYRRSESIVPQQALTLTNSALTLTESRKLARQLSEQISTTDEADQQFINMAFMHVLSRLPTDDEQAVCGEFLSRQQTILGDTSQLTEFAGKQETATAPSDDPAIRARENLVHVLMNHNDFVSVR